MRQLTQRDRLHRFMQALGAAADADMRAYLTGGASAVLLGWRDATIDVDLQLVPERDEVLRALEALKDRLQINVELASPAHFIPELPGWETRSVFIAREGHVTFYHYDFYAQALAKIERGHAQDRVDVDAMLSSGLIVPARVRQLFDTIEGELYRYPALDPASFRRAVDTTLRGRE